MPERRTRGIGFVEWAPSRDGGRVSLKVVPIASEHVRIWDRDIQPTIDTLPGRADRSWRWRRIAAISKLGGMRQKPDGFAVCVVHGAIEVPCVMVQLVGDFPALDDANARGVFLWYLADAPEPALRQLLPGDQIPKRLGTIGLDVAVSHAFRTSLLGRTSLHAATEGGSDLVKWYASRGMENLAAGAQRVSLFRANDGRYFFYTVDAALKASQQLDPYRSV